VTHALERPAVAPASPGKPFKKCSAALF
jgi:hypothetical protein